MPRKAMGCCIRNFDWRMLLASCVNEVVQSFFLDDRWQSVLSETTSLYSRGRHRVVVNTDLCSRLFENSFAETSGVGLVL